MTVDEIVAWYDGEQRPALAEAWRQLQQSIFRGVAEIDNFDPHLWLVEHRRVAAAAAHRPALAEWCRRRASGRWMFNAVATGDIYLFALPGDADAFKQHSDSLGAG